MCNIYAPNNVSERLQFIQELNSYLIDKAELTALIVGGDWNCTLFRKDKEGGTRWRPTSYRNAVLITMDVFDLIDIQREKYPNVNKYSYLSKALDVKSRIDFLLVAKNLTKYVKKSDIQPSIAPGHCAVYIILSIPEINSRGPGFRKFNNSLLADDEYLEMVGELYPFLRNKYKNVKDIQLFWELLKMEIRSATISFAKGKAKIRNMREFEVIKLLEEMDNVICNSDNLENVEKELKYYDELKRELNEIYERKGRAAMYRSKCRWVEKGERPTKYFFNLEKRNYDRKVISELETETGEHVTNETLILLEVKSYYNNLYSSETTATLNEYLQFSNDLEIPQLS